MGRDSSSDRAVHLGLELPEEIHGRLVDGWHMVAEKVDSQTSFTSRNGLDHTRRFPELVKALADLDASSIVLDGEVAIFDRQLISRFEWLRTRPKHEVMTPPMYMVFDLLELDGMAAGWPPPRALPT